MAKEIELKLRCAMDNLPVLTQLLDSIAKPQGSRQLNNTYYDTADTALVKAKAALRIREKHGEYEQTLKTRGQSMAGLQIRGEWNWPITSANLDASLLHSEEMQRHLPDDVIVSELHSIFSTNFTRFTWLYQQDNTKIEVAVDSGQVMAGSLSQPLCECELELLAGDVRVLWQLARTLGEHTALWLSDISKAERGYLLANLSPSWQNWQSKQQSLELMLQLDGALVHWQRALEAVVWENKQAHTTVAEAALDQIIELAKQLPSPLLIAAVSPWGSAQLDNLSADLKNNKILALSVQKAAFAFYQLSESHK